MKSLLMGYHKDCGGPVRLHGPIGARITVWYQCSRCQYQSELLPSVVPEGWRRLKQRTAGRRRYRPRFDIKSWNDVK